MNTIEKALERLKEKAASGPDEKLQQEEETPLSNNLSGQSEVLSNNPPPISQIQNLTGKESRSLDLDLERLGKMGFLTPEAGRTQLSEEMRQIKRSLLIHASKGGDGEGRRSNLIMITSSKPNEGKTYTSLNLAMSIAKERDKTVLLVDADIAKPGVTRLLEMGEAEGLVNYLLGEVTDISDIMLKTNVPNLRFIPAGKRHIHSTELLTSDRMISLVQGLCERYTDRIIILDSPPLLATSEASVLTELVGQIVMVVEAEKTTKQEIDEALSLVSEDVSVGLVLNKARGLYGSDYYGYYGSYGD